MYLEILETLWPLLRALLVLMGALWLVRGSGAALPMLLPWLTGPVLALAALSAYRSIDRRAWEDFGLHFRERVGRVLVWSLLPVVAGDGLFLVAARLTGLLVWPTGWLPAAPLLFRAFTMASLAALGLEFFFRGYLFRTMDRYGFPKALLLTVLLYGATEPLLLFQPVSWLSIAQAAMGSVLYTYLFYRTGSIWPPVVLHALFLLPPLLLPSTPEAAGALHIFSLALQLAVLLLLRRVLRLRPEEQQPVAEEYLSEASD